MPDIVRLEREGDIGLIVVDNPPVNALGQAVRQGLLARLAEAQADEGLRAVAVIGAGRTFMAGADIREFGKPPMPPGLGEVVDAFEASTKSTIAAIHGTALGGGLEVALGCHHRVALAGAKVGLPEVTLGLLPGAGGTQRLPRLVGLDAAIEIMTGGKPISAREAESLGILDAVDEGTDVRAAALAFARKVVDEGRPVRRTGALDDKLAAAREDRAVLEAARARVAKRSKGLVSPLLIVDAVEAALDMPLDQGLARERELFMQAMDSSQRKGLIHAFFAQRQAAKLAGEAADAKPRKVGEAAVIGAGTMGGGIAMNFANAGIPVWLLETDGAALEHGLATVRRNYESTVRKGRMTQAELDERMALIRPTLSYDDIAQADLVIEAVFEAMAVKKEVFAKLDAVMKPGAVLATNTSTLDIDEIAAATKRPQDVVGMHFFSPANVMKLLENVRGERTAGDVQATAMDVGRRIGKVTAMVGVCYGFVGNRMLHQRGAQATQLVEEGALPAEVDAALTDFGFPMGQFAMSDLAGIDVGWRIREERRKAGDPDAQAPSWLDRIAEMGRFGQKTGGGVYAYEAGDRTPRPAPEIDALIEGWRREKGINPRRIEAQEIVERCLYAMVNEGARILEEGIAARPGDIDVIWVHGYGFPAWRGGPMFWADEVGLPAIVAALDDYSKQPGGEALAPAPLLRRLAGEGKGFADLERA
ncbi:3-hydroxyacyl-CoA dehydrogenase NAD-binding domain-containing protein [Aureimonas mangrovi]|uniref:3-hydroxyacyl-CoA dehydrogenase NAD-binding domain-containing protein n=1 Tax=Aureimonas mangrovi TaxID=2758041 RepID=UPI00163D7585|nr:3-hydroxyacyl-CoA dehydrogenase NAD-binding domain-containing protein [Aureimonas mangrovi]